MDDAVVAVDGGGGAAWSTVVARWKKGRRGEREEGDDVSMKTQ